MRHRTPASQSATASDPRTRRILAMVDDVEAGRVEAEALQERYGLSLSEYPSRYPGLIAHAR